MEHQTHLLEQQPITVPPTQTSYHPQPTSSPLSPLSIWFKQQQAPIVTLFTLLHKTIDEMDTKIEEMMRQHDAEFLFAYRNHILKLKEELHDIRIKSEDQEKKILSDDHALMVEKQLIIFREEALSLYDKLGRKTEEADMYQRMVRDMQRTAAFKENENRIMMKSIKNLEANNVKLAARVKELEQEIMENKKSNGLPLKSDEKNIESVEIKEKVGTADQPNNGDKHNHNNNNNNNHSHSHNNNRNYHHPHRLSQPLPLKPAQRRSHTFQALSQPRSHELQHYFLSCLQSIRKEVAQRKNYSTNSLKLSSIDNFEEFKLIDKLRLLELVLQNEKLMVWLYEKIFPDRIGEIRQYFSADGTHTGKSYSMHTIVGQEGAQLEEYVSMISKGPVESQQLWGEHHKLSNHGKQDEYSKTGALETPIKYNGQELPSAKNEPHESAQQSEQNVPKSKQSLRNRILIRNGKLNLSSY